VNRFGWLMLTLFFTFGVFAFWSIEPRPAGLDAPPLPNPALAPIDAPLRIPVAGVAAARLVDSWEQSRANGSRTHQAIDIAAPGGTAVVAAMPGRVERLFESRDGGKTLYVRSKGGGWITYYAHLSAYDPGLAEGQLVSTGQRIGFVGDTGNAGAGNTHLHFALSRMGPGERWYQGTPVNPYPYLAAKPVAR
jgi:murein DD-endopeptidase MepM/ murein hydrolase activator NlpD